MNSYSQNPNLELRQMISGLKAYHMEGLQRVAELEQKFNTSLSNPDSFEGKPDVNKQEFVAFADGTGLTKKAFSKINEDDFDVILNLNTNSLRFRENPAKHSGLIDSELKNIGRRRIAFLAYLIEHPSKHINVNNASRFYDQLDGIERGTVTKTIQMLRKALGDSKNTYILTKSSWESLYSNYKLNLQWHYLLIK